MSYMKYALVFAIIMMCSDIILCECPDWSEVFEVKSSTLGDSKCVEDCHGEIEVSRTMTVNQGGSERDYQELFCIKGIADDSSETTTET